MTEPRRRLGPPPSRGLIDARWLRAAAGWLFHLYVRLVHATNRIERLGNRVVYEPTVFQHPTIYVSWHANIIATPHFFLPRLPKLVAMTAPHADGQIAAALVRAFGVKTIEGTGRNEKQTEGTGGLAAFRELMRALAVGHSVFLTAEVPPTPGRTVSRGVIRLARRSGRPIVAVAAASSRRSIIERLWDKMQIHHPFGRLVLIAAEPLIVDDTITDEAAAAALKRSLDDMYAEALMRADLRSPL